MFLPWTEFYREGWIQFSEIIDIIGSSLNHNLGWNLQLLSTAAIKQDIMWPFHSNTTILAVSLVVAKWSCKSFKWSTAVGAALEGLVQLQGSAVHRKLPKVQAFSPHITDLGGLNQLQLLHLPLHFSAAAHWCVQPIWGTAYLYSSDSIWRFFL